jgi:uncharacterized protein
MERKNKLAMVTGGSGGIGFELAKQFADHGFDVAISGQSDRVDESAEALRAKGVEAYPYQADASTYDGVEGFWRFVEDLGRPVDAAALNVGIGLGAKPGGFSGGCRRDHVHPRLLPHEDKGPR